MRTGLARHYIVVERLKSFKLNRYTVRVFCISPLRGCMTHGIYDRRGKSFIRDAEVTINGGVIIVKDITCTATPNCGNLLSVNSQVLISILLTIWRIIKIPVEA
jgi:hypothetical protein